MCWLTTLSELNQLTSTAFAGTTEYERDWPNWSLKAVLLHLADGCRLKRNERVSLVFASFANNTHVALSAELSGSLFLGSRGMDALEI